MNRQEALPARSAIASLQKTPLQRNVQVRRAHLDVFLCNAPIGVSAHEESTAMIRRSPERGLTISRAERRVSP